jgi:hypothetical protein
MTNLLFRVGHVAKRVGFDHFGRSADIPRRLCATHHEGNAEMAKMKRGDEEEDMKRRI